MIFKLIEKECAGLNVIVLKYYHNKMLSNFYKMDFGVDWVPPPSCDTDTGLTPG